MSEVLDDIVTGHHALKIYRELIMLNTPLRTVRVVLMESPKRKIMSIWKPSREIIIEAHPISAPNSLALALAITDHPDFATAFAMAFDRSSVVVGIVQSFKVTTESITALVGFGFDSTKD